MKLRGHPLPTGRIRTSSNTAFNAATSEGLRSGRTGGRRRRRGAWTWRDSPGRTLGDGGMGNDVAGPAGAASTSNAYAGTVVAGSSSRWRRERRSSAPGSTVAPRHHSCPWPSTAPRARIHGVGKRRDGHHVARLPAGGCWRASVAKVFARPHLQSTRGWSSAGARWRPRSGPARAVARPVGGRRRLSASSHRAGRGDDRQPRRLSGHASTSAPNGATTGSIMAEWNACDVLSTRQTTPSASSAPLNRATSSCPPATTQVPGAFSAASDSPADRRGCSCSSGSRTDSMAPPGCACIRRPRRPTKRSASPSSNTPASVAATTRPRLADQRLGHHAARHPQLRQRVFHAEDRRCITDVGSMASASSPTRRRAVQRQLVAHGLGAGVKRVANAGSARSARGPCPRTAHPGRGTGTPRRGVPGRLGQPRRPVRARRRVTASGTVDAVIDARCAKVFASDRQVQATSARRAGFASSGPPGA